MGVKRYTGEQVDVTFDGSRCIHVAECLRGAPETFDTSKRPWILPDGTDDADHLVGVVARCPSGALRSIRHDDGDPELPDQPASVFVQPSGPLHARGALQVCRPGESPDANGRPTDERALLCRCGQTGNAPFCDNSHNDDDVSFADAGRFPDDLPDGAHAQAAAGQVLLVRPLEGGPLKVTGPVTMRDAEGRIHTTTNVTLCRCGRSGRKPFCDGSHAA